MTTSALAASLGLVVACRTQPPPPVPWFAGEATKPGVLPPPVTETDVPAFVANFRIRSPEGDKDAFGASMSMGNRTLAVAAPDAAGGGAVWVFDTTDLSRPPSRLGPGDDATIAGFGRSVAVSSSGQYIAVGAPGSTVDDLPEAGVVLAWRRDPGAWRFIGRFRATDPVEGCHLGESVAINEQTLMAGAPDADGEETTHQGIVLAWTASPSRTWREAEVLKFEKGSGGARFGSSIALLGGDALVGAESSSSAVGTFSGSASLYRNQLGKWKPAPNAVVVGSRTGPVDRFGKSVSLYVDDRGRQPLKFDPTKTDPAMLAVGAPGANLPGKGNAGCIYVFQQNPKTRAWREDSRLMAPHPEDDAAFGTSVSISRDRLVVGSPGMGVAQTPDAGAAHVFEHRTDRDSDTMVWKPVAELRPDTPAVGGRFGSRVAATDDCIAVTEPGAGVVHLFRRTTQGPGLPLVPPATEAPKAPESAAPAASPAAPENPAPVASSASSV